MRIPAREIETAVAERLAAELDDPLALLGTAEFDLSAAELPALTGRAAELAATIRCRDAATISQLVRQVRVDGSGIELTCGAAALAGLLNARRAADAPATLLLRADVRLTRTGRMMRLVTPDGSAISSRTDASLPRLLARAHRWWRILGSEPVDVTRLAEREGVVPAYIPRVLRLAFLSPEVTRALVAGKQRPRWMSQR